MNTLTDKQKRFEALLKKKGIRVPGGVSLVKRNDPGPYKLSFAQRRIWFLQQFDTTSAAYNDPTALRIKGPLNIQVLQQTLNEIINRHRVLRMTFPGKEGEVSQAAHEKDRVDIQVTTLQKEPGKTITEQAREFVNHFSGQPFDLGKDLLFKAALLKIDDEDFILVVNIHHIVLDGWSKGIMLQELMDLYRDFSQGKPSSLAGLPLQYTDYVHWLHEWMKGKLFETQLSYWKEKLQGAPPLLELPTDFPRRGFASGRGSLEPFSLSQDMVRALDDLARKHDVTLFMVLTAAYNTLLFRYCGQGDILIGTPVAGRQRVELENLIGLFVNTLVIRTDLSGNPTFKTLLARVRSTALQAYAHQDIPFEKLVEELNPQRNLNITPLFQVMFQLQNAPMPPANIAGLLITPIQVDTGFAQVDLSLTLWEEEGTMKGTFEFNTDLFLRTTIKRMIGHFQGLLAGITADPEQPISCLPILTEQEKQQLLVEWNDTNSDYPDELCLYRLFEDCVQNNPTADAVIFKDLRLTYTQLNQQANQLCRFLLKKNVASETLVAICMENSLELITGVIGILKTGAAYIPLDPGYPDERLKIILNDACPRVLLTRTPDLNRFAGYEGEITCLDSQKDLLAKEPAANYKNDCRPGNTACVIFTSGSTGEPKGILLSNRNIVNLVYSFVRSYKPGPADNILPLTSIASASFVGEILPILTSGGSIVLADKVHFLDMKKLTGLMSDYRVTILSTVPSMIAQLNSAGLQPRGLRLLLSGGEALSAADIDHLQDSITIVNGYGLTEATICSTYVILNENRGDFSQDSHISVGSPIINTQVYILDKYCNPVPVGVPGEIYIGGDGLSRGYINNPELTAEMFIDFASGGHQGGFFVKPPPWTPRKTFVEEQGRRGEPCVRPAGDSSVIPSPGGVAAGRGGSVIPHHSDLLFKTGDLGCWLPHGAIKFLGRIDTQVQIHGHRIELSEIETHLGLHPDISDVVVIDREVVPGDRRLVAYLLARNGKKPTSSKLRDWLDKRIPDYMIPGVFELVDNIPLNINGKVDISALPEPSWDRPDLDVDYKAPQTPVEKSIAQIWQELLNVDKVGINDNFFDLGGHSLLLTRIHSRLNEMYQNNKELTIVDLFRYPTIHSLAKYLTSDEKKNANDVFNKIQLRAKKQRQSFQRKQFKVVK